MNEQKNKTVQQQEKKKNHTHISDNDDIVNRN